MILALAVVLGLFAALLRYRQQAFNHIATIPLRSLWLALVAVVLQLPLLRSPAGPIHALRLQQVLFLASQLLLLAFVWRNRYLPGVLVIGAGVALNLAVILANAGFMPITPETLASINPGSMVDQWPVGTHYGYSKDVIRLQEDTQLWILSDTLVLHPPFPWPTAFSPGDLLIAAGTVLVMVWGPAAAPSQPEEESWPTHE
jgi:hypothetical protein